MIQLLVKNWRVYVLIFAVLLGAGADHCLFGRETAGSGGVVAGTIHQTESSVQHVRVKTTTTEVVRPNGTVDKTTVVTSDTHTNTDVHESEHVSVVPTGTKSKYAVDVTTDPFDIHNAKIGVGARLGDLPAFGVLEYEIKDKTVRAGVRVEW